MKAFMHGVLALAVCALFSVSVFADKDKVKKHVTFADDTMVNGTMVKAGDYELKFNEETGELDIIKGNKVVATATGHMETIDAKANTTAYRVIANQLISVSFSGSNKELVLSSSGVSGSQ
jgi:hypothetical protein